MKNLLFASFFLFLAFGCQPISESTKQANPATKSIITSDIDNFWSAYDKVVTTKDSAAQATFLKEIFLDKGTLGLKKMMQARNYSPEEYRNAINTYPKFWSSVRDNTFKAHTLSEELEMGISKIRSLYPALKPAKIYFTVGALKSNGTTMDSCVLIGSELAFADKKTVTDEFPEYFSHLKGYFDSSPSENIVFLNVHEFFHTQQKTTIGENLLAQTVLEGVAEFLAEKALNQKSPNPQIEYGRKNDEKIKAKFEPEMFSPIVYNWIWNSPDNEFGMRDLAYYVGYIICENYYNNANDKKLAIKQMIELDYNNEAELIPFVDASRYFDKPLSEIRAHFDKSRPIVDNLGAIQNNTTSLNTETNILTINFSKEMHTGARNFELGPLGEDHVLRIKEFLGWSEDGKSVKFELEKLESQKKYEIVVGAGFTSKDNFPLVPYLIKVETGK